MNSVTNKIVIFLFVLNLFSCMDDEFISSTNQMEVNLFTLNIPEMSVVDIKTRSGNSNGIEDVLAVVIRNGVAHSESPNNADFENNTEGKLVVRLKTLNVQPDESLHIFCNVGNPSLEGVSTEDDLFKKVTCTSGKDVMYGIRVAGGSNSLNLKHSMSNVEVLIKESYSIDSLLVCNVPKVGYADGSGYITPDIEDLNFDYGSTQLFVSRLDNRTSKETTFLLAKLASKGWYRLDFYTNGKSLNSDTNYKDSLLNIESNTFYHFSIDSVKNDGYTTKEEARKNPGSNIVYGLSVDKNSSVSNGQYAIGVDKNVAMLLPGGSGSIDISAILPDIPINGLTTYSVRVHSGNNVSLSWEGKTGSIIDLMKNEVLTTENSNRTVSYTCTGAWIEDDYLEISLGNITKKIPFKILTANCYFFDCNSGDTIYIPYIQANLEAYKPSKPSKVRRIEKGDVETIGIIWADQPNCNLKLQADEDKGWFAVTSPMGFTGNVLVGAKDKDGNILWSWHIWCIANEDNTIEFKNGMFDYNPHLIQRYGDFEWMNRNLGAYNLEIGKASIRGLGYTHGRKDPFILAADELPPAPRENGSFDDAPIYGPDGSLLDFNGSYPGGDSFYKQFDDEKNDQNDIKIFEYTVAHPYCLPVLMNDYWNWRFKHGDYWLTENGGKSGYDPCPVGWRLPYLKDPLGPWYPFNYNNRAVNPLDPTEEFGMSWKTDDGELAYYPYCPNRSSVLEKKGLVQSFTTKNSDPELMVNKTIFMNFADELSILAGSIRAGHRGFVVRNEYNVNYPWQQSVSHWGTAEAYYATTTRCVRDKSIKLN